MFQPNPLPEPGPRRASVAPALPTLRGPRDLADFCLRWQEFRPHAASILARGALDPGQEECLNWLIALADRVRSDDLGTGPL